MSNLTQDRNTQFRLGDEINLGVAASTTLYLGAMVSVLGGVAVPPTVTGVSGVLGVAQETVANTGATGAKTINVKTNVCGKFDQVGTTDTITLLNFGSNCYIKDDHTVGATTFTSAVPAGKVLGVDSDGVWVHFTP